MALDDEGVEVLGLLLGQAVEPEVVQHEQVGGEVAAEGGFEAVVGARLAELVQEEVGAAEEDRVGGAGGGGTERLQAATVPLPAMLASQKRAEGRSPARRKAATAVARGSMPTTTAPCEASTRCIAQALHTGKPMITPRTTTASARHWAASGRGCRVRKSSSAAGTAAKTERPSPTTSGSRDATAKRVAIYKRQRYSDHAPLTIDFDYPL